MNDSRLIGPINNCYECPYFEHQAANGNSDWCSLSEYAFDYDDRIPDFCELPTVIEILIKILSKEEKNS